MGTPEVFSAPWARSVAVTLGALVTAVLVTAGAPLYLPFTQTDNIGVPILVFPFIWLGLLFTSAFLRRALFAWLLLVALAVPHAALVYMALSGQWG